MSDYIDDLEDKKESLEDCKITAQEISDDIEKLEDIYAKLKKLVKGYPDKEKELDSIINHKELGYLCVDSEDYISPDMFQDCIDDVQYDIDQAEEDEKFREQRGWY